MRVCALLGWKNVDFSIYGTTALVPNTVDINRTNGMEGFGSLGLQANNCHSMMVHPSLSFFSMVG